MIQEYFMNQGRPVDTEMLSFNLPVFYVSSDELQTC
jgi:hypothetical protein